MSAMHVVPAYADDGIPPVPVENPITSEPTSTITEVVTADPLNAPASSELLPLVPDATNAIVVEDQAAGQSEADLLLSDPSTVTTELVVTDTDGTSIPLATSEAAQAIEVIDPIWCPVGIAPKANIGGCSNSFPDLLNLVNNFVPRANGVIWIQSGADASAGSITIDGTPGTGNWSSAANFALTLNGGWNGTQGTTGINGVSTFNQNLSIINWVGAVTLQNITASGVAGDNPNLADGCLSALCVETKGNVLFNNIISSNHPTEGGAQIDNSAGTGTVTVKSSRFQNDGGDAVIIKSNGLVTISDILVSNSSGTFGMKIDTTKNVVLNGTNQFFNSIHSLDITTPVDVVVNNLVVSGGDCINITARNINLTGSSIFTQIGSSCHLIASGTVTARNITVTKLDATFGGLLISASGSVTLNGVNNFSLNTGGVGLVIHSNGPITLNNITAHNNGGGGVTVTGGFGAVVVNGANIFSNGSSGLDIKSFGNISVTNITSSKNSGTGVKLDNNEPGSTGNISVNGYLITEHNTFSGAEISSAGVITMTNVASNYNGSNGAVIDNQFNPSVSKGVSLLGTNTFIGNGGMGLNIISFGNISVNALTANENLVAGASFISNNLLSNSSVILTGVTTVNFNGNPVAHSGDGLTITVDGNVTITGLTANTNGANGANIVNNGTFTLGGTNQFIGNGLNGLFVRSLRTISIQNSTAQDNVAAGFVLDNDELSAVGNVAIGGYLIAERNGSVGLLVNSDGIVTVANLTANFNSKGGVSITNRADANIARGVTITGNNNIVGNGDFGLIVQSFGNIFVNNLTATNNAPVISPITSVFFGGVDLDTLNNLVNSSVTLSGINTINFNGDATTHDGNGLNIIADGAVVLNNLTANNNSNNGASISAGSLTLAGNNSFSNNYFAGLGVFTSGNVLANSVSADANGGVGVNIVTATDPALIRNVTFTGVNRFNNNGYSGLVIGANGVVTLSNITANDNGQTNTVDMGFGVQVHNCMTNAGLCTITTPSNVVLLGKNNFNGNFSSGLSVQSLGAILVNNITANNNGVHGAFLKNKFNSTIQQSVTVTASGMFNSNGSRGLLVESFGAMTLANITADQNGHRGVSLDNTGGLVAKNISITGASYFINNSLNGLFFNTDGTFTGTRITAAFNGTSGAGRGVFGTAKGTITLVCGMMFNNKDWGYNFTSNVSITLNNVVTFSNPSGDVFSAPTVNIFGSTCPLP
ncbi:MAG: hypothetical protein U0Z26_10185 [Anaerolineales bacterium]